MAHGDYDIRGESCSAASKILCSMALRIAPTEPVEQKNLLF